MTDANAHPHVSSDGKFALVHNGVIENYAGMKKFLAGKGYTFASETDTEALVNLIAYHYKKETGRPDTSRFLESVRKTLRHVEGTYGIAVLCTDHPGEIVAARKGSPLILGIGDGEFLLASDVSANHQPHAERRLPEGWRDCPCHAKELHHHDRTSTMWRRWSTA